MNPGKGTTFILYFLNIFFIDKGNLSNIPSFLKKDIGNYSYMGAGSVVY